MIPFTDQNLTTEAAKLKTKTFAKLNARFPNIAFTSIVSAVDRLKIPGFAYSKTTGAKPLPPRDRACPKPAGKSGKKKPEAGE